MLCCASLNTKGRVEKLFPTNQEVFFGLAVLGFVGRIVNVEVGEIPEVRRQ